MSRSQPKIRRTADTAALNPGNRVQMADWPPRKAVNLPEAIAKSDDADFLRELIQNAA